MDTREIMAYNTWYEFKKELQRRTGIIILNSLWLRIKPKEPLPWHEFQMRQKIGLLAGKILKMKNCPRCSGHLITDRDVDGFYRRCIQCSFTVEIISPLENGLPNKIGSLKH